MPLGVTTWRSRAHHCSMCVARLRAANSPYASDPEQSPAKRCADTAGQSGSIGRNVRPYIRKDQLYATVFLTSAGILVARDRHFFTFTDDPNLLRTHTAHQ
jgi:hypothetical protein